MDSPAWEVKAALVEVEQATPAVVGRAALVARQRALMDCAAADTFVVVAVTKAPGLQVAA